MKKIAYFLLVFISFSLKAMEPSNLQLINRGKKTHKAPLIPPSPPKHPRLDQPSVQHPRSNSADDWVSAAIEALEIYIKQLKQPPQDSLYFESSVEIQQPIYEEKEEEKTQCNLCSKICANPKQFWQHRNKIHYSKIFKCPFCSQTPSFHTMEKHMALIHELNVRKMNFICPYCKEELESCNFIIHSKECLKKLGYILKNKNIVGYMPPKSVAEKTIHSCPMPDCNQFFDHEWSLHTHVNLHIQNKLYACEFLNCFARFKDKGSLAIHEKYTHQ